MSLTTFLYVAGQGSFLLTLLPLPIIVVLVLLVVLVLFLVLFDRVFECFWDFQWPFLVLVALLEEGKGIWGGGGVVASVGVSEGDHCLSLSAALGLSESDT